MLKRLEALLYTRRAYSALFKGGWVLIASAVLALSQLGPEFYAKDLEAHKLLFEAEYAIEQPIDKKTDCSKVGQHQVSCRLAQHHMLTLDGTLRLWETYTHAAFAGGVVLITLGVFGFFMELLTPRKPGVDKSA